MKARIFPSRTASRAGVAAIAILAAGLGLSGCVSAVDETSAFGFSANGSLSEIASQEAVLGEEAAEGDTASADAATAPEAEAVQEVAAAPAAGEDVAAAEQPAAPAAADDARTPTMVAFAAPNEPSRAPGRSLYESLFTESEARTPVRNAETGRSSRVVVTRTDGAGRAQRDAALPGVDPSSLFEIGQRASVDDEDFLDDIGGSYQVASLSGMARLAPSGFLVQRDDIITNCFDTELVGLLRQIERRFGQRVVITSGYRSPAHNRRVNGAKASMHMACKAADLHVPGVSGQTVAAYVRSLPRRGGVGTYCHTAAIHVDVGRQRDWNWPCRQRRQG